MNSQKVHVIPSSVPTQIEEKEPFSSFWSWTFNLSTFPFFILGFPFYLLTLKSNITTPPIIYSTKQWLKSIFSVEFGVAPLIVSIFLLAPTIFVNAFVSYEIGNVFNHLFVQGQYSTELVWEIIYLLRYIPIVIPLDYVWLRGYKIRNMIQEWDYLHWKYHGYGVASMWVRCKVIQITIGIIGINLIKGSSYFRQQFEDDEITTFKKVEVVIDAVLDLCISLMIPLYCIFCYAVKFQLLIVKAMIYQWIHLRAVPMIYHLNSVKQMYTEAADNILKINGMFSLYLSVAILMVIVDTISDSENVWEGMLKVFGGGGIMALVEMLIKRSPEESTATEGSDEAADVLTPAEIRVINMEIAGIVITYFLIFYMVRQAVATNDTAREINVWLNDFVVGGSGTNVVSVLKQLGAEVEADNNPNDKNAVTREEFGDEGDGQVPPIWAKTTDDDEFIKKFQMLKAYIHVRMQVEKPSLLRITLIGFIMPVLNRRLKRYQVLF